MTRAQTASEYAQGLLDVFRDLAEGFNTRDYNLAASFLHRDIPLLRVAEQQHREEAIEHVSSVLKVWDWHVGSDPEDMAQAIVDEVLGTGGEE